MDKAFKIKANELVQKFKTEITTRAKEIDPGEEIDWFSMSLGWAIANGLTITEAHQFSIWLRYDLHYLM